MVEHNDWTPTKAITNGKDARPGWQRFIDTHTPNTLKALVGFSFLESSDPEGDVLYNDYMSSAGMRLIHWIRLSAISGIYARYI